MEMAVVDRLVLAAIGIVALASSACAQGDVAAGRQLALSWCTACHVVDVDGHGTDVGPALPMLLGDGVRTPDEIRGWLSDPHPPMPNFNLSRQEIEDIVAYLQSLENP
jgi:mono/diheme cytochrome c family protein